jgi:hypothetical protein
LFLKQITNKHEKVTLSPYNLLTLYSILTLPFINRGGNLKNGGLIDAGGGNMDLMPESSSSKKKTIGKKEKKSNQANVSDMGVTNLDTTSGANGNGDKALDDSFEKYYNKDLDLDEGI